MVASEDQRFREHHGFDFEAVVDALEDSLDGEKLRGASTLSQQVAKNLFLWNGRSLVRKGLEAWLTGWIELLWPKRRILEVYLNVAQFGPGVYGVGAASESFFGKPAAQLAPGEAALLAAALPNPLRLRVAAPGPYLAQRRRWVERQMRALGGAAFLADL